MGTKLLNGCVKAHLREEITALRPARICVLGQVPLRGLKRCFDGLPGQVRTLQGASCQIFVGEILTPVLITCFPDGRQGPGVQRQLVRQRLEGWKAIQNFKP